MKTWSWMFKAFLIFTILYSNKSKAQVDDCVILSIKDTSFAKIKFIPNVNIGTHINGIGVDCIMTKLFLLTATSCLETNLRSGTKYFLSYLGIPGSSYTLEQQITCSYNFGRAEISKFRCNKLYANVLSYYYIGYFSTDNTSQLSGGMKYQHNNSKYEFNFVIEDDFLAFFELDQYRTFAFELNKKEIDKKNIVGLGAGLIFWTGTTVGLGFLHRNQTYNLTRQYGGLYSNGIAYLKVYYNNLSLSIGYDSEGIRSTLQNSFHNLIDDGKIPALNRGGRFFLQLSYWDLGSLY
ncbi:MAG: polymorphic toxin type 23 domain-containing protein [Flavipsychrobacter sp.]|nr:polymorphic toxin type 23 domain-containing protein [Flavipsychrobacter sp.]